MAARVREDARQLRNDASMLETHAATLEEAAESLTPEEATHLVSELRAKIPELVDN